MSVKRLVVFASAKGGVGKSYASRAFVDLARRASRRISAWDLDGGTGSLAMFYPERDPEVGAGVENVRSPKAPGKWLDALHGIADDVVLDVPGGALTDLVRILTGGISSLIAEAKVAGREIVVASVIGIKRDATGAPQDSLKMFGSDAHHVVIKNGFFGDPEDFIIFDGKPAGDNAQGRKYGKTGEAVKEAGGEVLFLPKLDPLTDALLDDEGLTFAGASEAVAVIGRRHSSNARYWLDSVEAAFTGTWLSPSGEVSAVPSLNGKATRVRAVSIGG
jgi:hypothetical protein